MKKKSKLVEMESMCIKKKQKKKLKLSNDWQYSTYFYIENQKLEKKNAITQEFRHIYMHLTQQHATQNIL